MREIQSKRRYFLAFIIGTAIFLIGFGITYAISYLEFQRVTNMQGPLSYSIFQEKLKYSFFNKSLCSEESFLDVSKELAFQGRIIDDLEKKLGKNNENVIFRKKFYSLIEVEHLEFIEIRNKQCNESINTITFFYSNEQKDAKASEDAGELLNVLSSKYPSLKIYSFDINLDSDLVKQLMQMHKVTKSPSVVINEKKLIESPKNTKEIENYLY